MNRWSTKSYFIKKQTITEGEENIKTLPNYVNYVKDSERQLMIIDKKTHQKLDKDPTQEYSPYYCRIETNDHR